jgi:outer membrane lipoprotein carrier protein
MNRFVPGLVLFAVAAAAIPATQASDARAQAQATSGDVTAGPPASTATCIGLTAAPPVDQAVACVQWVYDQSRTFQATFEQQFTVKAYATQKTSSGDVFFEKPGKMLWRYKSPPNNRVVSDGAVIKVYEANNSQMYEQAMGKSQYPAALSFLTGTGNLGQAFDFTLMPGAQLGFPGGYVLVGAPKSPTPAYSKVLFYVDLGTSQVRRVMIIDGQGNRNRFDFNNPQFNLAVAPGLFQYTPPPGTTIVRP